MCVYTQVNGDLVGALARANRADVIRELHLYTGASLDSTDGEGLTALHHAVLEGHLQAVKALIQALLFFTDILVPNFLHKKRVSGGHAPTQRGAHTEPRFATGIQHVCT